MYYFHVCTHTPSQTHNYAVYFLTDSFTWSFVFVTDGSDFNSRLFEVTFEPRDDLSSQVECIPLPIIDDLIANEANEQFLVSLTNVVPSVVVSNNETCVTILDDDSKYT